MQFLVIAVIMISAILSGLAALKNSEFGIDKYPIELHIFFYFIQEYADCLIVKLEMTKQSVMELLTGGPTIRKAKGALSSTTVAARATRTDFTPKQSVEKNVCSDC